jgi:uncharacterized tellurite resistance protein B-like protein
MFNILKKLLTDELNAGAQASGINQPHKLHVATCAILLEMAKVDGEFSDEERKNITSVFKTKYVLTDDEISSLIDAAETELESSIDMWQFTHMINKNYSLEEKKGIIETIWQVAYADGRLDKHEDYLMHKLAELLNISHKDLINAKLKVLHPES